MWNNFSNVLFFNYLFIVYNSVSFIDNEPVEILSLRN